jgi:hypothetical protein
MKIKRTIKNNELNMEIEITLTPDEICQAHVQFVTDWMESALINDFKVPESLSGTIAEEAYEIYSQGDGFTEYESVEKAYEKYNSNL